jgi:hypothetical protein
MKRTGRNESCLCGSGKKYKKCCLRMPAPLTENSCRRSTSKLALSLNAPTEVLKAKALSFFHTGYFEDSFEVCKELARRTELKGRVKEVWALAAVSLGCLDNTYYQFKNDHSPQGAEGNLPPVKIAIGPQGMSPFPVESPHLTSEMFDALREYPMECLAAQIRDSTFSNDALEAAVVGLQKGINDELGMIPASAHPTAALLVAEWLLDRNLRIEFARELVQSCLGWIYRFQRLEDLTRLARLLSVLKAPKIVWTQLINFYCDFVIETGIKRCFAKDGGSNEKLEMLQYGETERLKTEFQRYCASSGLPEWQELMDRFFDVLKVFEEKCDSHCHYPGSGAYSSVEPLNWVIGEAMQRQHPWFCLLNQTERDFLRNGDNGFATCITDDYSFACSQWWRCIESVLKRKLIEPIGNLLNANHEWIKQDRATGKPSESDEIFVNLLAVEDRRRNISLAQMLVVLDKCISDTRKRFAAKSMVRCGVTAYVSANLSEFRWIKGERDDFSDLRSEFTPNLLNEKSIKMFRNATSHDEPMTFIQAAVGRLLAIRILDFIHYPRYCVTEKRDELKRELSDPRRETSS